MSAFTKILKDKSTNNLIVAFMIATATVNFVYFVGQQVIAPITQSGGPTWSWDIFWPQLIIWVIVILVAVFISTFAKGK